MSIFEEETGSKIKRVVITLASVLLAGAVILNSAPAFARCPFPVPPPPPEAYAYAAQHMPRHIRFHFAPAHEIEDACSTFWDWRVACAKFIPGEVGTALYAPEVWIPLAGVDGIDTECQLQIFDHEVIWHVAGQHPEDPS